MNPEDLHYSLRARGIVDIYLPDKAVRRRLQLLLRLGAQPAISLGQNCLERSIWDLRACLLTIWVELTPTVILSWISGMKVLLRPMECSPDACCQVMIENQADIAVAYLHHLSYS